MDTWKILKITSGKGGNGGKSFENSIKKKKYPNGGAGGHGGDIIINCVKGDFIFNIKNHSSIVGEKGERGRENKKKGKEGKEKFLKIPENVYVYFLCKNRKNILGKFLLTKDNSITIKGGQGGIGNNFNSDNQEGKEGKTFWLKFILFRRWIIFENWTKNQKEILLKLLFPQKNFIEEKTFFLINDWIIIFPNQKITKDQIHDYVSWERISLKNKNDNLKIILSDRNLI